MLALLELTTHRGVELARLDDFRQALHRHTVAVAGEVAVEVVLEPAAQTHTLGALDLIEAVDHTRVDDGRALRAQLVDRAREHLHDLGIGGFAFVGRPQHADARALQPAANQRRRVVLREV